MTPNLSSQEPLVLHTAQQEISVSVLLPFEPRAQSRKSIDAALKRLMATVETRLLQQVSRQVTRQVCGQLQQLFDQLDYGMAARSVAFWVQPDKGKLVYWQVPMTEAVVVGEGFDARGLLAYRKEEKQYLLLAIGDHFGGIYLGNGRQLSRLVANAPVSAGSNRGVDPSVGAGPQKQLDLERSVRHFDNALSILQRVYRLPVFIVAPAAHIRSFRHQSVNARHATALIEVPVSINEYALQQVMDPYLDNWQSLKEKRLQVQLEEALQAGKLAVGISEVWTAAIEKRGKLLVAETDYQYPAYIDPKGGMIYADAIPISQASRQTRDAVADTIERVLASGGKVELVRNGTLTDYVHVAMICY